MGVKMPYILKDKDGNILTFGETSFNIEPESGMTMTFEGLSFYEYSRRLVLSHNGQSCITVQAYQSGPDVQIDIDTPLPLSSIDIDINGVVESVSLFEGKGKLTLSTANPGIFILSPADRKTFCAAGQSVIAVEVAPNA